MRVRSSGLIRLSALLAVVWMATATAVAQYGHPLKGSWSGEWGTGPSDRTRVLISMDWDGKIVSGVLNPGSEGEAPLKVDVDPATWTVRFEVDVTDESGRAVRYQAEGKVENLGSPHRHIAGTWSQGERKGDFRIVRN